MKALVYEKAHAIEDFAIELVDLDEPTARDQDVLVDVRAVGINPGEAQIRGTRTAEPGGRVLLGFEFAGVVSAIGSGVDRFKVGDRVFGTGDPSRDGAWAERVAVDHRVMARIPDNLSFSDAASMPIGVATAWEAIFRDQQSLPSGIDRILIVGGAGAVGSMATQILKTMTKATVIATASRKASRDWCEAMGADIVVDHAGDVAGQLKAAGHTSVDLIFSTANTAGNSGWITEVLRPFGHVSIVDGSFPDLGQLMSKSASIHLEMVFSRIVAGCQPERQGAILEAIATLVSAGRIRPIATTVLHGLTSETMRSAHDLVEKRRTEGKIVIEL